MALKSTSKNQDAPESAKAGEHDGSDATHDVATEHADYVPDSHNQPVDDQLDQDDGTAITS